MKKICKFISTLLALLFICQAIPITAIDLDRLNNEDVQSTISDSGTEIVSEDITLRSEYVKHFLLNNGTYLAVQYNHPVHDLNENNEWVDLTTDFSFQQASDDSVDFDGFVSSSKGKELKVSNSSDALKVKLTNKEETDRINSLTLENITSLPNQVSAQIIEPNTNPNQDGESYEESIDRIIRNSAATSTVEFPDIYTGVDFIYKATYSGYEGKIILDNTAGINTFSFELEAPGLTAEINDTGNVCFIDEFGNINYIITNPIIYDSSNKACGRVNQTISSGENDNYILSVSIEKNSEDEIEYPITIDNSVIATKLHDSSVDFFTVSTDDSVISDNKINGYKTGTIDGEIYRSYFTFNELPVLEKIDTFVSAKFQVTQLFSRSNINPYNLSTSIGAYSISEPWDFETLSWDTQPLYSNIELCSKEFVELNTYQKVEWNISEDISKHYAGSNSYGIVFESTNEINEGCLTTLCSSFSDMYSSYLLVNYIKNIPLSDDVSKDNSIDCVIQEELDTFEEVSSSIISTDTVDTKSTESESTTNILSSTERVYEEITSEITVQYCNNGIWHQINGAVKFEDDEAFDAIKIQTDYNEPYYFRYRAKNKVNGWSNYVYSYDDIATSFENTNNTDASITNLAIEVFDGRGRIYDHYVVMYRAKVNGVWLDWVSNGQPSVMQTIKTEYSIEENLDTSATDAGWSTLGDGLIKGLEIRVFKGSGYTDNNSSKQFVEITDFVQKYMVGSSTEYNLDSTIYLERIDGIRLDTTNTESEFYFKYCSKNTDNRTNFHSYVYSYKKGPYDYAGMYGYAMRNLEIQVFSSDGTRLFDDYVVMYRVKVAGEWLDWVSNGHPYVMHTIKSEYKLKGNLDLTATNAGWYSKGNIQSIDIRMFKRIETSNTGSSAGVETNAFEKASDITMKYYADGNTSPQNFNNSGISSNVNSMNGISIQTSEKPYYFLYRVSDHNTDTGITWDTNLTTSNSISSMARISTPMTYLEIQVFTKHNTRIYDDFVVMYRAKTAQGWLDWVSNGQPRVMDSIMTQFPDTYLSSTPDYKATNAGQASKGHIQAIEIHVYERRGLTAKPTGNYEIIDVPYINQIDEGLFNGCESVSTVMALSNAKMIIDPNFFVSNYLDMGSTPVIGGFGPDPDDVFVGKPYRKDGWGCNVPVIKKALDKFVGRYNATATPLNNVSLEDLCTTYIRNGKPVVIWATVMMTPDYKIRRWTTPEGKSIAYNNKLHSLLLVGYDDEFYYFNDPMLEGGGQYSYVGYAKERVEAAYTALGCQAIVIERSSGNTVILGGVTDTTVTTQKEIDKAQSTSKDYVADPIDLSTGAHIINHNLMTIYGAQTLSFNINYSSNLATCDSLGIGWSHNYEKKIVDEGNIIKVFDNATYFAQYIATPDDPSTYTTNTITKTNYVLTKTSNGYVVNCNHHSIEYYDTSGKLYKITTKGGFNTIIQYPSASSMKIIDEISGRYMLIQKNEMGKIISVEDNTGRKSLLEYSNECISTITDPVGSKLVYTYDKNTHKILTGKDNANINFFSNTYDLSGRVTGQKDTSIFGLETDISYEELEDGENTYTVVTVKDRNNDKSVYKYNSLHQLISKIDANGNETKYAYDDRGNLIKTTDGRGYSIIYSYDENNNLELTVDKRGKETKYIYCLRNNNLVKIIYPNNGIVTNVYDPNNRIISSTDLRGVVTTYEYDEQNMLIKTISTENVNNSQRITEYFYCKGQVSKIIDSLGRETINKYNPAGFLTSTTDANNNTTVYEYDPKGTMLTASTSINGETKTISKKYDSNGCLVESIDMNGNKTTYTYNGNLKMESMTLPTGVTLEYSYDNEDRLICVTYPDGTTEETEYDDGGRIKYQYSKEEDSEGNKYKTEYFYDAADNIVKIKDANGKITLKEYDAAGNLTKVIGPCVEGAEATCDIYTLYEYDCMGNIKKVYNSLHGKSNNNATSEYGIHSAETTINGVTVYRYSKAGDLLSVTDPLGNTTTNEYDSFGNLTKVTDPRGHSTTYTYDSVGNLLTVTNALGEVTVNTYDYLNRLISTKDPGGHTTSFAYDELGRQISCTDARGNTIHTYYDANGNVIKITDQSENIDFEATYDEGNRVVETTDAAGSKTAYKYDFAGNMTQVVDALGHTTKYTYDANGQMISSIDANGGDCYASYDGMGNLTSMTGTNKDTQGGVSRSLKEYIYDAAGRVIQENDIGKNYYTYNALGLKIKVFDASRRPTDIVYDECGRITSITDYVGTSTYTYDANGNILTATDSTGTVRREYDALNRVTKYTDIYGNIVEYEYNSCGMLSKMTYPTGEVAIYTYDANHNMLTSSLEGSTHITTYEYNDQNQITKERRPDGSVLTKVYNDAGRLSSITDLDKHGNIIVAGVYVYDALGQIIEEISMESMSKYEMTYDALGRLVNRTEYDLNNLNVVKSEETFTYDAAGNIIKDTSSDGTSNEAKYNANNRMTTYNNKRYGTDINGNTTFTKVNGSYVEVRYDNRNRLTNVAGDTYSYTYDVENNRINFYAASTNTKYTYDTSDGRNRLVWTIDHEYNVTTYAYGAEGLIWSLCDGEYMIYHYDYRGSVVAVTDIDGNVTDTIKYDAYGSVAERTGTSKLIFGYNGKYGVLSDPNGLIYMRTRFYSPTLKRFMNADIIDGSIADSTTLNVFAYVNGNPISYVDPFGLCRDDAQKSLGLIYEDIYLPPSFLLSTIPWKDLTYPGEIHNAVVKYLSITYGLESEHVSSVNIHNRYDLYLAEPESYWEVKPISYLTNVSKHEAMQTQMARYDADGVPRGMPLGISEMPYKQFNVKIYSEIPGEIYYTFQYKEALEEAPALVPYPERQQELQTAYELGGDVVAGVALGTALIAVGVYMYVYMPGDLTYISQGIEKLTTMTNQFNLCLQ